eukprot:scaffold48703_cov29-Phaeocystis_antarctica.AAC.1
MRCSAWQSSDADLQLLVRRMLEARLAGRVGLATFNLPHEASRVEGRGRGESLVRRAGPLPVVAVDGVEVEPGVALDVEAVAIRLAQPPAARQHLAHPRRHLAWCAAEAHLCCAQRKRCSRDAWGDSDGRGAHGCNLERIGLQPEGVGLQPRRLKC